MPALKVKLEIPQGYARVKHGRVRAKDLVVEIPLRNPEDTGSKGPYGG